MMVLSAGVIAGAISMAVSHGVGKLFGVSGL